MDRTSEIIITVLAVIVIGFTVISSTKQSLTKAKELNTRDQITLLQSAMNSRVEKKINLLTYLEGKVLHDDYNKKTYKNKN